MRNSGGNDRIILAWITPDVFALIGMLFVVVRLGDISWCLLFETDDH